MYVAQSDAKYILSNTPKNKYSQLLCYLFSRRPTDQLSLLRVCKDMYVHIKKVIRFLVYVAEKVEKVVEKMSSDEKTSWD